jgi:hypothetical protein
MREKYYRFTILSILVTGFASGFYFKFLKSYINDSQIEEENNHRKNSSREPRLGEIFTFPEELESIKNLHKIASKEYGIALRRLKTINSVFLTIMIISFLGLLCSFQKIIKKNNDESAKRKEQKITIYHYLRRIEVISKLQHIIN